MSEMTEDQIMEARVRSWTRAVDTAEDDVRALQNAVHAAEDNLTVTYIEADDIHWPSYNTAEARLTEARAGLTEAETRLTEARAGLTEARAGLGKASPELEALITEG